MESYLYRANNARFIHEADLSAGRALKGLSLVKREHDKPRLSTGRSFSSHGTNIDEHSVWKQ